MTAKPGDRIRASDLRDVTDPDVEGRARFWEIRRADYGDYFFVTRESDNRAIGHCQREKCMSRLWDLLLAGSFFASHFLDCELESLCDMFADAGVPASSGYLDDMTGDIIIENEFLPAEAMRG